MVDFEHARKAMVDSQLRTSNITDWRLLAAFSAVPREIFVAEDRKDLAYIDAAQPIGHGRQMSAPTPLGKLVQLAEIDATDTVLDVGCGTGYAAAILSSLAGNVVALDNSGDLVAEARENLAALDIRNVRVIEGALDAGAKAQGPFNVILIEGAVSAVPEALFTQLAEGGRIVVAIGSGVTQVAHVFVKAGKDVTSRAEFDARVPPLATPKPQQQFVF